jgi:hypothetical protein
MFPLLAVVERATVDSASNCRATVKLPAALKAIVTGLRVLELNTFRLTPFISWLTTLLVLLEVRDTLRLNICTGASAVPIGAEVLIFTEDALSRPEPVVLMVPNEPVKEMLPTVSENPTGAAIVSMLAAVNP